MKSPKLFFTIAGLCCAAWPLVAAEAAPDYLKVVRAYADTMIQHGRDEYGSVKSPLFASTLDRTTLKVPEKFVGTIEGIRNSDRALGANPMHDQNLYQVLYALSEITGDARYAAEADKALRWFFEHCQSPATGLVTWGEHLSWDFRTEGVPAGTDPNEAIHEFYRPWVFWDRTLQLAPEPAHTFAVGVWRHQIRDPQTCEFSRHARYGKHGPSRGHEFPRHGGFYIATWAAVYQQTKDPELLTAIERLVAFFESRRNPKSRAIPAEGFTLELMWPQSNLSYAIDLWDSAKLVPAPLAKAMRDSAAKTDAVYLQMKQDLSPGGKGFIKSAYTTNLEAGDIREVLLHRTQERWYPYSHTWATGYGMYTDAQLAMLCLLRYQQIHTEGYRKLFLDAARRYLTSEPDTSIALFPGAVAEAIATLVAAYRLTGEKIYLERADVFGRKALQLFFDGSPLPRASTRHQHYETITRGDTLVMELLDLWAATTKPDLKLKLVWNER
jgi:hypothetical protein